MVEVTSASTDPRPATVRTIRNRRRPARPEWRHPLDRHFHHWLRYGSGVVPRAKANRLGTPRSGLSPDTRATIRHATRIAAGRIHKDFAKNPGLDTGSVPTVHAAPHYDGPVTSGVSSWFTTRRRSDTWRHLVVIAAAVVLANGAFILLGYESSPIWWTTNIASRVCAWSCGLPSIDPNVGFITQPEGHLAAVSILHGHVPWWNYFEGMGQPLAGEMQSAAFLPLVVLFIFPAGLLMFHLALQLIAGFATYFLIRRMGLASNTATLAGTLFALNGTFAWIGNAVINPIAFLPLTILGVEILMEATRERRRAGWAVLAVALALSIYAGFPETTYLDGLMAAGWAITRLFDLPRARRLAGVGRLALGALMGGALSLPIIVAFYDFTKSADVGGHVAGGVGVGTTALSSLNLLINPYLGGMIIGGPAATPHNFLGYFTASVLVFALVGASGRTRRPLRLYLAGWTLFSLAGAMNLLDIHRLVNLMPGVGDIAFARYIWPSAEFAVIVLAALGLNDILEGAGRRSLARWVVAGVGGLLLVGVISFAKIAGPATGSDRAIVFGLVMIPFLVLALIGYGLYFHHGHWLRRLTIGAMVFESMIFFAVPTLRNPTSITIATGSINYLQQNQGLHRFITLGVLTPNWGAQYSLFELNAVDLPLPAAFTQYVHTSLAPSLKVPRRFTLPFTTASQDEVAAHLANYESLGVDYLLTPPSPLDATLAKAGLTLVAHDERSNLYEFPHSADFYSTELSTCVIADATVDHVQITCPTATTLTRLELPMPGWTARVNGVATAITSSTGLTQTLQIPAGTSRVSFDFLPPHEVPAGLIAVLALLLTALAPTSIGRRRRRRPGRPDSHASRPEDAPSPGTLAGANDEEPDAMVDADVVEVTWRRPG